MEKEKSEIIEEKLKETDRGNRMRMLDLHAHLYCLSEEFEKQNDIVGQKSEKAAASDEKECREKINALGKDRGCGKAAVRLNAAKQELALRRRHGILTCFSGGTPAEWEFLSKLRGKEEMLCSFGVHPWYADQHEPEQYGETLRNCDVLGEIGMDSVWCQVPLDRQRRILERQLQMAADLHKPVILHTKGQEAEIARMIRDFPNPVCVHWYSGDLESLEAFQALDCYFTLGPDVAPVCRKDPASLRGEEAEKRALYRRMLRTIPLERLFLETDGITAVAWARNVEHLELEEIPAVLTENRAYLADQKRKTEADIQAAIERNLQEFLGRV